MASVIFCHCPFTVLTVRGSSPISASEGVRSCLLPPDHQVAWQWAYSTFGDARSTLGSKRFTNETTNPTMGTTTGTTTITRGDLQPVLLGAVLRQGERPWMRQWNAPEGARIGVPGKA